MLPLAGGLFDQPGSWLLKMEAVLRADAEDAKARSNRYEAEKKLEDKVRGIQGERT